MEESVTNRFLKVECLAGRVYLVRVNGPLWHPFTRENEDYNLKQLRLNNIPSSVLYNGHEHGFQICHLQQETYRFSNLAADKKTPDLFRDIALTIKKVHHINNFKNNYCIGSTIHTTFSRMEEKNKTILMQFYSSIMSILATLFADTDNFVFSHNDLLPSSIHYTGVQTTLVDWEYSGQNHRSYDLALFSIKARLSVEQEQQLLGSYDRQCRHNTQYNHIIMKPIVDFLLLQWALASPKVSNESVTALLDKLLDDLGGAAKLQVSKLKPMPTNIRFFKNSQPEEEHKQHVANLLVKGS
jgi:thiamine kinase-like enzyme